MVNIKQATMDSLLYGHPEMPREQPQAVIDKPKFIIRHRTQITEDILRNRKNYDIVWKLEPLCSTCGSMQHRTRSHYDLTK